MKKTLIALAVLGSFAGAAVAQSSATLYGLLDVGYGIGNGGIMGSESSYDFQQLGNANSTSRWGVRGQEDLGNGKAVYFNLESQIAPETGVTGGTSGGGAFNRAAIVGVKGGFGAVQAGRQLTVMNNILGAYDISGTPNMTSALTNARISAVSQRTTGSRYDSALLYISPNFSGFSFQAALILKNDDGVSPLTQDKNVYSAGANYVNGPFSVGAAFESKHADGMSASWGLGARFNFTSFVISGGYFDNHVEAEGKGFYLGAAIPVNAFTIGAQVALNIDGNAGDYDALALELFAKYKVSNRTQLYLQTGYLNSDAEDWNQAGRKYSASFGIVHRF